MDGGATNQVFLYPVGFDWNIVREKLRVNGNPDVYLIRNARLKPHWEATKPKLPDIADRTTSSLIRTQGIGDMFRIYVGAKKDRLNYHLAIIPDEFNEQSREPFDREYMTKLFQLAYEMARNGYPWERTPPVTGAP